jgi:hypothetical protein
MLRMAAMPVAVLGPTRCSQMSSPLFASSACTMFVVLVRNITPLCTIGVGSLVWPSFIAHAHVSCRSFTLSRVICVSGTVAPALIVAARHQPVAAS